jgi:deoxyribose-phosphate aldolase
MRLGECSTRSRANPQRNRFTPIALGGEDLRIDFSDKRQIAKSIQYTNVNPDLIREGLIAHARRCIELGFQAAMVGPCWVALTKEILRGTDVRVASTLNFPMPNDTLTMKLAALRELAKAGADEFDFPPNPGLLLGGEDAAYRQKLNEIVRVAHGEGPTVKAMLELGFITTPDVKAGLLVTRARPASIGSSNRAAAARAAAWRLSRTLASCGPTSHRRAE